MFVLEKHSYYDIKYKGLEYIINTFLGPNSRYFVPRSLWNAHNDTWIVKTATKMNDEQLDYFNQHSLGDIEAVRSGTKTTSNLEDILNYLATNNAIPEGNYLIEISW